MNVNNLLNVSFGNLSITNLQKDVNIFMHVYKFNLLIFCLFVFFPNKTVK